MMTTSELTEYTGWSYVFVFILLKKGVITRKYLKTNSKSKKLIYDKAEIDAVLSEMESYISLRQFALMLGFTEHAIRARYMCNAPGFPQPVTPKIAKNSHAKIIWFKRDDVNNFIKNAPVFSRGWLLS